ncbi:hypothetical protein [Streptomyces sp. GQFP]|uniref:hypothetical protein n=1 Tax=Streptomyces sp. GQFP TaxID=2907545 RepID=UPI001F34CE15|nr:hypothetical protein [Streptomyces sp. GQFP]UIX32345.1 hypothetical protein LUX31_21155 [Streptomyces sp. GQFP]
MHDLFRRTLHWVSLLFAPGTGRRRRVRRHPHLCVDITAVRRPSAPPPLYLPRHRSPYGLVTFLDGTDSVLVRPYLTDTVDFDPHLIGAQQVAA